MTKTKPLTDEPLKCTGMDWLHLINRRYVDIIMSLFYITFLLPTYNPLVSSMGSGKLEREAVPDLQEIKGQFPLPLDLPTPKCPL